MYQQEITRRRRTAFVIAVDQSLSMCERTEWQYSRGQTLTKAEAVARAVNELLCELENRARREEGVCDYFDVAVVGYGDGRVERLLDDGRDFVPVSELRLCDHVRRKYVVGRTTRSGEHIFAEEFLDEWIEADAVGSTPMYEALWEIRNMVRRWCSDPRNADSFPPVVINITDGGASDCNEKELLHVCDEIRHLGTSDGCVLLMNIHITTGDTHAAKIFPTTAEIEGEDRCARLLAQCSSVMPPVFDRLIGLSRKDDVAPPYLAMGYNTAPKDIFSLLNIGSRSVTGIR